MRKALLIIFLAFTVLVAGCVSQNSGDNNAPGTDSGEQNQTDGGENIVRYSSSGFAPGTIRINAGESVTWVNENGPRMWVAADVHPTHAQYDGTSLQEHCSNGGNSFDQCGNGERYTFAFEEEGTWRYHNHDRPAHTGTVIVE